jgi:hypothetical protein
VAGATGAALTGAGSGGRIGVVEQAARVPRIAASPPRAHHPMLLLILEALGALLIFVFIIWWTMFSGRNKGERRDD